MSVFIESKHCPKIACSKVYSFFSLTRQYVNVIRLKNINLISFCCILGFFLLLPHLFILLIFREYESLNCSKSQNHKRYNQRSITPLTPSTHCPVGKQSHSYSCVSSVLPSVKMGKHTHSFPYFLSHLNTHTNYPPSSLICFFK